MLTVVNVLKCRKSWKILIIQKVIFRILNSHEYCIDIIKVRNTEYDENSDAANILIYLC